MPEVNRVKQYGFLEPTISDDNYVFGGLGDGPGEIINPEGKWPHPDKEPQEINNFDTFGRRSGLAIDVPGVPCLERFSLFIENCSITGFHCTYERDKCGPFFQDVENNIYILLCPILEELSNDERHKLVLQFLEQVKLGM